MILLNVTYTVKPGKRDEFFKAVNEAAVPQKTRAEKGNIKYDFYFPAEEPDKILLYEMWENAEILAAHLKTDHIAELQGIKEKYTIDFDVKKYEATTL